MIVNSSRCQASGWATHSLSLYLIDTQTQTRAHTDAHTVPLCLRPNRLVKIHSRNRGARDRDRRQGEEKGGRRGEERQIKLDCCSLRKDGEMEMIW